MTLDRNLRLKNLLVPQGAFQGRLHLHLAELVDGEVQVSFVVNGNYGRGRRRVVVEADYSNIIEGMQEGVE